MERITDRTPGPHGREAYRAPSVARDGIREQQDERRRGTAPARRDGSLRGVLVDPAKLNVLA